MAIHFAFAGAGVAALVAAKTVGKLIDGEDLADAVSKSTKEVAKTAVDFFGYAATDSLLKNK